MTVGRPNKIPILAIFDNSSIFGPHDVTSCLLDVISCAYNLCYDTVEIIIPT